MTINNLYASYDDDGNRHHFINNEEVPEDQWLQQHPHLKRGIGNGRNGSQDSGSVGDGDQQVESARNPKEQVQQAIQRARQVREAQRAGSAGDAVGQPKAGPE